MSSDEVGRQIAAAVASLMMEAAAEGIEELLLTTEVKTEALKQAYVKLGYFR